MANSEDPDQIWICTVCKGRVCLGSAGQGLSAKILLCLPLLMAFQTKMVNIISLYLFIWHTSSAEYYVPKYSNGVPLISVTKIQRPNTFVDAISECFDQNVQLRRLT